MKFLQNCGRGPWIFDEISSFFWWNFIKIVDVSLWSIQIMDTILDILTNECQQNCMNFHQFWWKFIQFWWNFINIAKVKPWQTFEKCMNGKEKIRFWRNFIKNVGMTLNNWWKFIQNPMVMLTLLMKFHQMSSKLYEFWWNCMNFHQNS